MSEICQIICIRSHQPQLSHLYLQVNHPLLSDARSFDQRRIDLVVLLVFVSHLLGKFHLLLINCLLGEFYLRLVNHLLGEFHLLLVNCLLGEFHLLLINPLLDELHLLLVIRVLGKFHLLLVTVCYYHYFLNFIILIFVPG